MEMEQTKVYHGTTVHDGGTSNPPPYTPTPPGVYPQQPGPYPQQPYTQQPQFAGPQVVHATVVNTVPVVLASSMGPNPTRMTCKSCNYEIVTRIETKPSFRTHCFAALLCVIGCWPCVCLPYCMSSCVNTDHFCPNCNAYIGTYLT